MKGFRFQKRIKIAPGVRINLSKSGISASLGGPGATVNVGKKGVRGTVGATGTGLSYSKTLTDGNQEPTVDKRPLTAGKVLVAVALGLSFAIFATYLAS